ncbi:MAG: sodium-dependent transporter [Luteimonas sp.]
MQSDNNKGTPLWSSPFAFYLSAVGGAVGLGSIWRFPYLAGSSGGSAFIFVFVISCLLIATPLLAAEFMLGRRSRSSPPQAAGVVAQSSGLSTRWNVIGGMGTVATFMIMSYYGLIAGWVLAYTWKVGAGQLVGLDRPGVASLWREFLSRPFELGAWHLGFMMVVALISARGLQRGIEAADKVRAPVLLALLLMLVAYALATGDVRNGLAFAFAPNFAAITPQVALAAIGQAFFATGVGMAMMLAYGSYVQTGTSLVRCALIVVGSILLVSLLATLMIFPLVFDYGLDPAQGTELVFNVLPMAFAEMPGGRVIGTLFFLLLIFAALTPSIAGIEPVVAWLQQRHGFSRPVASFAVAGACWVVGIGSMLSFNLWADWRPFSAFAVFRDSTVFDLMDYVASNILLLVGALLTSIFVGWRISRAIVDEQLAQTPPLSRRMVIWLLRYLCPVAVLAVLVTGLIGS